ncbi:MAG TPA: XylR family transcriptional regulator [Opitutaceae bacterium]|nr:XylR family transcriptional regulator [Opitutaceae bacterium]
MRPQVLLIFQTRFEEATDMLQGISKYERSHRPWAAFLDDQARAEVDPRWLRTKRWHGVISRHTTQSFVDECRILGIPLVDLNDTPMFKGVHKIRPDNISLGHMGAEHFIERGYQHFGFCGYNNHEWASERRRGFEEALGLAGFRCDVFDVEYPGNLDPIWDKEQISKISTWLKSLPKPLAVMACHDMRALQIVEACQVAGLMVPEEVAVLGINNDKIRCQLAYPPLSSAAPNSFLSGYTAAELLDQLMNGKKIKPVENRIEPIGVVIRHSSDVLAIEDKAVATALSFIRENACFGISVTEVLKQVPASRSQLEKKFRQFIGRSPQAEIRHVQIGKVKQLLFETDFPLKKIAELTGFEHPEYMSVVFKRMTNFSPGAFRGRVQPDKKHETD